MIYKKVKKQYDTAFIKMLSSDQHRKFRSRDKTVVRRHLLIEVDSLVQSDSAQTMRLFWYFLHSKKYPEMNTFLTHLDQHYLNI